MPEDLSGFHEVQVLRERRPRPPVQAPEDPPIGPNEIVRSYQRGEEYPAEVGLGTPLNIVLQAGEGVLNVVGGDRSPVEQGETPPWQVESTTPENRVPHVWVTVSRAGLKMGLDINTDRRIYYLKLRSVAHTPIRAVRWTYPPAPPLPEPPPLRLWPEEGHPYAIHVGYEVEASTPAPAWFPRMVWDDGTKVFLLFPPTTRFAKAPLVRGLGSQGPELINSRLWNTVLILDTLVEGAELRAGTGARAETVVIRRGVLRRITCPGDAACPTLPPHPTLRLDAQE